MILLPSLITFLIALIAIYITVNASDEIVRLAATFTALLCCMLSLIFSPWFVKLLVILALVLSKNPNSLAPTAPD